MIGAIAEVTVDPRVDPAPLLAGAGAEAGADLAPPRETIREEGDRRGTGRGIHTGRRDRTFEKGARPVRKRWTTRITTTDIDWIILATLTWNDSPSQLRASEFGGRLSRSGLEIRAEIHSVLVVHRGLLG